MFDSDALLLFIAAGLLLNLTPGPDMLYVIARTLGQGRAAGFASALGIGVGCFAHILAAAFGLTALLSAVPNAFDAVRLVGAAYLVWLGAKQIFARSDGAAAEAPQISSLGRIFRQGVITNVLNPKVALFFLAFLPQFVDPARGDAALQFLALGALFDVNGMLVLAAVVLAASRLRGLFQVGRARQMLERMMGAAFIGLGIRLAWK
ncbi:LysE family translocator [Roseiterribacter gracilis]|uniref:Lysine transporter LysE n=1 Tax=Roseiterribacter gracilis TaxID=2812848 RepID=A0A8S8X9I0_9PROT|nr:lysine transporter LysE [Rhodospirillales bacterium TMPK1]